MPKVRRTQCWIFSTVGASFRDTSQITGKQKESDYFLFADHSSSTVEFASRKADEVDSGRVRGSRSLFMKFTARQRKHSLLNFLLLLAAIDAFAAGAHAQGLKVTLLGTGYPQPRMDRFGPSILVEAGKERLLFDCGRGAAQRLEQIRVPFAEVSALFLTHLHSDHVVGIPDLWLTGWILGRKAVSEKFLLRFDGNHSSPHQYLP
jgi:Metallo-beta-lactamase superfamily